MLLTELLNMLMSNIVVAIINNNNEITNFQINDLFCNR